MNRLAISVGTGMGAGLAATAAYGGALYAGLHPSDTVIAAGAALLAFSGSVAAVTQSWLNRPAPKPSPNRLLSMTLSQLSRPEFAYVTAMPRRNSARHARFLVDYQSDAKLLEMHKDLDGATDIQLIFKKAGDKQLYNPLKVKAIFERLKSVPGFQHVVLVDERDEFIGYIPGFWAKTNLGGEGAEAKIAKYILNVLAKPETAGVLRDIYGFATPDQISDHDTVAHAIDRMGGGLVRGLVVMHGTRHRRPVGIVYWNDLYKIVSQR